MSQKLNTPKGTRDFSSFELKKREYLLNILKSCFKTFNFQGTTKCPGLVHKDIWKKVGDINN